MVRIIIVVYTILFLWFISTLLSVNYANIVKNRSLSFVKRINDFVAMRERKRFEGIKKGEIRGFRKKMHNFVNDLMIDLGVKKAGVPETEFLLFVIAGCGLIAVLGSLLLFGNVVLGILATPFLIVLFFCVMYSKTSGTRYTRLMDILMMEKILANDIRAGIVEAVNRNIDAMPKTVKKQLEVFVDDVKVRNIEIEEALNMLSTDLGKTSTEFIRKVIVLEKYDEPGYVEIFKDIIEINNIKIDNRSQLDVAFNEINTDFTLSTLLVGAATVGSIFAVPILKHFYFNNLAGQLLILIAAIIIIIVYMRLTLLKAKEV